MQKITVLLPVKNGEKYISQAVDSVLKQTYKNFELLIFNDESTDGTLTILKKYQDKRIKIFSGTSGFIANLNKGLEIAKGSFVARMDADDIMNPIRLETQCKIMENSNIDVCGTWVKIFGIGFDSFIQRSYEGIIEEPLQKMIVGNFLAHPTTMLRREFLIRNNLKYFDYPYAQDYKLWFEIAKKNGVFYMEPKALLFYRISKDQITRTYPELTIQQSIVVQKEIIEHLLAHSCIADQTKLLALYTELCQFEGLGLVSFKSIANVFHEIFTN